MLVASVGGVQAEERDEAASRVRPHSCVASHPPCHPPTLLPLSLQDIKLSKQVHIYLQEFHIQYIIYYSSILNFTPIAQNLTFFFSLFPFSSDYTSSTTGELLILEQYRYRIRQINLLL